MTPLDLIEKFAEYIDYRKDQTHYILDSRNFRMSYALEKLPKLQGYDPTGQLSLLYIKNALRQELAYTSVSVLDLIENPALINADRDMYAAFCSSVVTDVVETLANIVTELLCRAANTPLLGDASDIENRLLSASETLVDDLAKCHEHVWLTSGAPMSRIDNISSRIRVFGSAREMLEEFMSEPPQITVAYVGQAKSTDGFFGIFASQDGNVFSLDDFIPEMYPSQHEHSRNGRYLNAKAFHLFPYESMVAMSEPDYKGWFQNYEVGDDLDMLSMPEERYLPLVLALMCVNNSIENRILDEEARLYVSSASPAALSAIPAPEDNAIVRVRNELARIEDTSHLTQLTEEQIVQGITARGNAAPVMHEKSFHGDRKTDTNARNVVIARYSDNFKLSGDLYAPVDEFIADVASIEDLAVREGRLQLERHILSSIERDFDDFGGMSALYDWFTERCDEHRDKLVELCIDRYIADSQSDPDDITHASRYSVILFSHDADVPMRSIHQVKDLDRDLTTPHPCNEVELEHTWGGDLVKNLLSTDGKRCRVLFAFHPESHEDLRAVFGDNIPAPLSWWTRNPDPFGYAGNCLLDRTDPITEMKHPLAGYSFDCDFRGLQTRVNRNEFRPYAQIGFTKREINKLVKQRKEASDASTE